MKRFAQQLDVLRVALEGIQTSEKQPVCDAVVNRKPGNEKHELVGHENRNGCSEKQETVALVNSSNQNQNKRSVGEPSSKPLQPMAAEQARSLPRPLTGRLSDIVAVVQQNQKHRKLDPDPNPKPSNPHVLPDHVSCQTKIKDYFGVLFFGSNMFKIVTILTWLVSTVGFRWASF